MVSLRLVRLSRRFISSNVVSSSSRNPTSSDDGLLSSISPSSMTRYGPGGRSSVNELNVTVFGCTGFLGRYVVNRLAKQGTQVVLPYRGEQDDCRHLKVMGDLGRLVTVPFHLDDEVSISKAVRHSDVVMNLIGRDYETKNFSWNHVHVEGARRIARICREEGVGRLIHVSTLNSNIHSPSGFLRSKAEGELAVKEVFPQAILVRPATLFGFEDRFFNRMAWFNVLPFGFPLYQHGNQKLRPVYVLDVATALHRMTVNATDSSGPIYEFYGPKEYSYFELVDYFEKITRKSINRIHLPNFAFRLFGRFMDLFPRSTLALDEVIRMGIDDQITSGTSTLSLSDLEIKSTPIEKVAIQFLRNFRSSTFYNEPISDSDYYGPRSS